MSLIINDPRAEKLASELALLTGQPVGSVVVQALEASAERQRATTPAPISVEAIMRLAARSGSLANRDPRTPEEILGYDRNGLFVTH